ncbi:retrovirus-related pol polyprotein from transposon TNT 1-94 [Tanacetum coccineum]
MAASSPVCLMSKATSTKSWLWHYILSHLNFGTINDLTRHDLVDGLPKFKYSKDRLCSACERGKSKKYSHQPNLVPSTHSKLELLHMDLYGPMRVETINGKKLIEEVATWAGSVVIEKYENLEKGLGSFEANGKGGLPWPMYGRIFEKISSEVSINSVAQQVYNNEESPSKSSIIIEEQEALPIVSKSEEQTSLISLNNVDEFNQEDFADFDDNTVFIPYDALNFEEAESSTIALDPSNMHETSSSSITPYIFTNQSQYAIDLLKNHGMDDYFSTSTPMATERLDAALQGTPTDQTTYR